MSDWLVEAVQEADSRLQPARIGAGWGESDIGIYRRETGPTGGMSWAKCRIAPSIRPWVWSGSTTWTATPSRFCSATDVIRSPWDRVHGGLDRLPGPARDVLETCLGGTAIFLQACGGNINPRPGIGYEVDCRDVKGRIGMALGGEKPCGSPPGFEPTWSPEDGIPLGNVSNILFRPWRSAQGDTCTYLGAVEETIGLEFGNLPSRQEAERIRDQWSAELERRKAGHARQWEIRVAARFSEWSENLLAAEADHPTLDLEAQAIRVNDIVLVGMNMEIFFETGLAIKARSPLIHTLPLGYTNSSHQLPAPGSGLSRGGLATGRDLPRAGPALPILWRAGRTAARCRGDCRR